MAGRSRKGASKAGGASEAADPKTPPEALFELAEKHPVAVAKNPALDVISFENPALWHRIVARCRYGKASRELTSAINALSRRGRVQLLLDMEERAGVERDAQIYLDEVDIPATKLRKAADDLAQDAAAAHLKRERGLDPKLGWFGVFMELVRKGDLVAWEIARAEEREKQLSLALDAREMWS